MHLAVWMKIQQEQGDSAEHIVIIDIFKHLFATKGSLV